MSAAEALLAFSNTREAWQQDALRRLFTQTHCSEADLAELLAILKLKFGLSDEKAPTPVPLTNSHVPQRSADSPPVILNSVSNLLNANRLATGQMLPFNLKGLTLIYGDNGSGKSGYCRVLKKLCRVREGGLEEIRGDAFAPPAAGATAEVTVRYTIGGSDPVETRWKDRNDAPAALSRISVFDARTVGLYADQQNKIMFLPHELHVLTGLGELCDRLSAKLDQEKVKLEERIKLPLPAVAPGTSVAALLAKLGTTTMAQDWPSKAAIEAACRWAPEDSAALEQAEKELLQDAESLANKCRQNARTIESLQRDVASASSLDTEALDGYRSQWTEAQTAREAAILAASQAKGDDLLPGFGSDAWRRLFKYAREYNGIAYPGVQFPAVKDGARCLLCQVPIDAEAAARFQRFETYLQGAAEAAASEQEAKLEALKSRLKGLALRSPADAQALLASLPSEDPGTVALTTSVVTFFESLSARRSAVTAALTNGAWSEIQAPPESPAAPLKAALERFLAQAQAHEASRDPEARKALRARVDELRSKKIAADNLFQILKRHDDLDALTRITACKTACDTKPISRLNTELRRQYLTKDFEDRLARELQDLALQHIPFKIQEKSDRGASYVGVGLETAVKVKNRDVLSDGEFRALALACFLSEVNGIPGHDGIVIDDPVSSLDHLRTRVVAERLVKEAQNRQVIVFTHDMVFYHELDNAAVDLGVPVVRHWIRRTEEQGFGTILAQEHPWLAKSIPQRLEALVPRIAQIRKLDPGAGEAYRAAAKDFYTDLRETWERLVEDLLFNGAVSRFQLGVKTQSLAGAEVTHDDHKRVFVGMKRASLFSGHDRAAGAQQAPPRPEEMQKDLDDLKTYAAELKKRKSKLEDERKRLEKPQQGTLVP